MAFSQGSNLDRRDMGSLRCMRVYGCVNSCYLNMCPKGLQSRSSCIIYLKLFFQSNTSTSPKHNISLLARIVSITVAAIAIFALVPVPVFAEGPAVRYNIPQRIIIPAIGLDSVVETVGYEIRSQHGKLYREWNTSDNLVGWHSLSAPVGHVGNTVLAGHSDIYSRIFQDLPRVKRGHVITLYSGQQVRRYVVVDIREVREYGASLSQRIENGRLISRTNDERLTLITCNRPGATHRLVVIARPVR